MGVGRVVIECRAVGDDDHEYRVWTERDGRGFGEVRTGLAVEAIAALMEKVEDGAAWVPEPGASA